MVIMTKHVGKGTGLAFLEGMNRKITMWGFCSIHIIRLRAG
jgi:hypothetical protein